MKGATDLHCHWPQGFEVRLGCFVEFVSATRLIRRRSAHLHYYEHSLPNFEVCRGDVLPSCIVSERSRTVERNSYLQDPQRSDWELKEQEGLQNRALYLWLAGIV